MSAGASFDLDAYLAARRRAVDLALERYLPPAVAEPPVVHEAMRYSVFAGGKRLRPILVIAAAEAAGGHLADVMPTACCFELIHTYSLIHDDLPAMDDDDFRRGRPTSHKVFGEAVAILAGDALLTHGLHLVAVNAGLGKTALDTLPRVLAEITEAAGTPGMLSVVVPAHNEEGHIAETVRDLAAALKAAEIRYEIVVINDNSSDGTERILATLNAADPCIAMSGRDCDSRTIRSLHTSKF